MTDKNQEVRETTEALLYRPNESLDDWGVIRTASGEVFATVRRPLSLEEASKHRSNGTDPFEDLARSLMSALASAPPPAVPDAVGVRERLCGLLAMSVASEDDFNRLSPAGFRLLHEIKLALGAPVISDASAALESAAAWHDAQDKAISKQPNANVGHNGWMRSEHQDQAALLRAALSSIEPTPSPELQAVLDRHQAMYDDWLAAALARPADEQFNAATALAANVGCVLVNEPDHPDAPGPGGFERAAEAAFARSGGDTAIVTAEDYRASPEPQASNAGAVEARGRFAHYDNKSLAGQCRMQAREALDPDLEAFMLAVSDRLLADAAALTTPEPQTGERDTVSYAAGFEAGGRIERERGDVLEELLEAERTAREAAEREISVERNKREIDGLDALYAAQGWEEAANREKARAEAAERRLAEVEERAREDTLDNLMWRLDHVRTPYCMQIRQFLIERGAMRPDSRAKARAALRAKPEAQAIVGKEVGE